jgi:hypothetical protein
MLGFNPNMISTAQTQQFGSHRDMARAAGPIIPYEFKELKPKKQLKEIRKVLLPEKKRFIFKYGYKFNLQYRCVICGSQQQWDISDPMRPPMPLSNVNKGRPLMGTYCPKHAGIFKQMEMLQQQILAEEHGLEFRGYLPRPKIPTLKRGPLVDLNQTDITSLISVGWAIQPPQGTKETPNEQYVRLMAEIVNKMKQIENLVGLIDRGE